MLTERKSHVEITLLVGIDAEIVFTLGQHGIATTATVACRAGPLQSQPGRIRRPNNTPVIVSKFRNGGDVFGVVDNHASARSANRMCELLAFDYPTISPTSLRTNTSDNLSS
ncbi:hypothetical protein J6590_003405 [Homalodisca vitripennis]|nr:hypothetical protein J6590_101059 [Homalodisca vitripennis]KAG8289072.1 hypothetical protein J6590_003405 [Homalodisca vitripennis]